MLSPKTGYENPKNSVSEIKKNHLLKIRDISAEQTVAAGYTTENK